MDQLATREQVPTLDQNISSIWLCAGRIQDIDVQEEDSGLFVGAKDCVFGRLQVVGEFDSIDVIDVAWSAFVLGFA